MPGVKSVTFLRNEKLQGISRISPSLTLLRNWSKSTGGGGGGSEVVIHLESIIHIHIHIHLSIK